ncbi:hypothetical protein PV325_009311 [Microctonus aethiopoides]|nr:hypothetical protein PV325_009311 [Microctonus aethiopoides]
MINIDKENEEEEDEYISNPLDEYEGDRNDKGERHGYGKTLSSNGDVYIGEYRQGFRHGKGLYVFKNGSKYDGEWRCGLKHGQGIFWYPDGTRYEGEWKDDTKCGFGIYEYMNKDIYEGGWKKNNRHGLGTYKYFESSVKFIGTWIEDKMQGPGQLVYPQYSFYGSWEFNTPLGRGCFVFENDTMQHGHFIRRSKSNSMVNDSKKQMNNGSKLLNENSFPAWCPQFLTSYNPDLLPPAATPLEEIKSNCNSSIFHKEPTGERKP